MTTVHAPGTRPAPRQPSTQRTPLPRLVLGYAGWDLRRNIRMVESTFFVIVLPAVLYLIFGAMADYSDESAGHGNISSYTMIAMAVYGSVTAMTAIAGSAAVERQQGWGRQLGLTNLSSGGYFAGKTLVGLAMAALPVLAVFGVAMLTGARLDDLWRWFAVCGLILVGALPFALYGLAAALLFRSEAAVSAASGVLVVLAFFGNLFVPLSGIVLDIARFTPLYGTGALARWPLLEGTVVSTSGVEGSDPLWAIVLNVVVWTAIFGTICALAARRRTSRA